MSLFLTIHLVSRFHCLVIIKLNVQQGDPVCNIETPNPLASTAVPTFLIKLIHVNLLRATSNGMKQVE